MNRINTLFLEALKASLNNTQVDWAEGSVSAEEFSMLFRAAGVHHVVPMIFEAVFSCGAFFVADPRQMMALRRSVMQMIAMQAMKTEEFKVLFQTLLEADVRPCVVKGVICRSLYPNPDARASGDEDVFIRPEDFHKVHELFLKSGMTLAEPEQDIEAVYEVPYMHSGGSLVIELHKHLFPPENEAYGDMNRFFDHVHESLLETEACEGHFLTMKPTDHLLYLICHSFKHFLHSGFGIRQVCDILLYANRYGSEVDWSYVLESCREIRADLFAASMFRIGEKYLVFDPEKACISDDWKTIDVNETPMLEDLLASGVFGQSDMSRKHSSNITINAVIADRRGKKQNGGLMSSLFPPVSYMKNRYTYLKRFPFLLPVSWVQRVLNYRKESGAKGSGNNASDSIRIGNQRVDLLRQYGIIRSSK